MLGATEHRWSSESNPGLVGGLELVGCLEGYKGEWLGGFAESLGSCSAVKAKIRAVLRSLKLARERKTARLWLQLDSIIVVGMEG